MHVTSGFTILQTRDRVRRNREKQTGDAQNRSYSLPPHRRDCKPRDLRCTINDADALSVRLPHLRFQLPIFCGVVLFVLRDLAKMRRLIFAFFRRVAASRHCATPVAVRASELEDI